MSVLIFGVLDVEIPSHIRPEFAHIFGERWLPVVSQGRDDEALFAACVEKYGDERVVRRVGRRTISPADSLRHAEGFLMDFASKEQMERGFLLLSAVYTDILDVFLFNVGDVMAIGSEVGCVVETTSGRTQIVLGSEVASFVTSSRLAPWLDESPDGSWF